VSAPRFAAVAAFEKVLLGEDDVRSLAIEVFAFNQLGLTLLIGHAGQLCVGALHESVVLQVIPFSDLGEAIEGFLRVAGSVSLFDLALESSAGSAELFPQVIRMMAGSHAIRKLARPEPVSIHPELVHCTGCARESGLSFFQGFCRRAVVDLQQHDAERHHSRAATTGVRIPTDWTVAG
jgi:hypothetical protein